MAEFSARSVERTSEGRRDTTTAYRLWGRLAVVAAAAVLGLAACTGGSGSPHVANLGNTGSHGRGQSTTGGIGGSSATTLPEGNPTRLLDEWAVCMRAHGDPGQADPTIDANKDIDITISPSVRGGYDGYSGEYGSGGPGVYCRAYLTAAQTALGGGPGATPHYDTATLEKYSTCMRANGIPDFPDPSADGSISMQIRADGDLNPTNPAFQNASRMCAQKTGVHLAGGAASPPGIIKLNGSGPAPGGHGG